MRSRWRLDFTSISAASSSWRALEVRGWLAGVTVLKYAVDLLSHSALKYFMLCLLLHVCTSEVKA